jgi:hypothetical protein
VPAWWWVLAALLHILPFAARPVLIGGDEPHYALAAHSLASDFDLDLADDYRAVEQGSKAAGVRRTGQTLDRHVRQVGDRTLFSHPIGLPLLAAPILFLAGAVLPGAAPDIPLVLLTLTVTGAAVLSAWRWLSEFLADPRRAAIGIAAVYGSTPLWYYNRTFFTEPYVASFVVLAAVALARRRAWSCGLWLGTALAMKETAALAAGPLLVAAVAWLGWRVALRAAAGPLLFGALFLAKNWALAGTPWVTFQPFHSGPWARGAWGLLSDPRHGLVWFAPLLLLAVPTLRPLRPLRTLRRASGDERGARIARRTAWASFVAYLTLTAAWSDWGGGTSYGTRLLLPALPALAVIVVLGWPAFGAGLRRCAAALFVAGFTIEWCAVTDPVPAMWSISASELLSRRPAMTLAGLAIAAAGVAWAVLVPSRHRGAS